MNHEEGVSTSHFDTGTITFDIFLPDGILGSRYIRFLNNIYDFKSKIIAWQIIFIS